MISGRVLFQRLGHYLKQNKTKALPNSLGYKLFLWKTLQKTFNQKSETW